MDTEIPKSQYQHYIPQFLLRNFSYPYKKQKKAKPKTQQRLYAGQEMLHAVNLAKAPPKLVEVPVKTTFSDIDMYKDDSKFTRKEQMHVEEKLSRLESTVSLVIRKIVKAQKNGKNDIWLARPEKDLLRKFIFVMKYRSRHFFKRFNHQEAEGYDANDKDEFLDYMRKKSFRRPLDVWFHNLTEIIDMKMDPAGKWADDLSDRIYPGDAAWVSSSIRGMYLALCTPSDPSEEFILTENAFSIHEGPVSRSIDRRTGETIKEFCTECHVLSVISPSLMMILRDNLLPEPFEDRDEDLRRGRAALRMAYMWPHHDPNAKSLLEDLPVAKARNSYSEVVDGQLVPIEGESKDRACLSSDRFCFTFFRLPSEHVQMLNAVMLDQACKISFLVYQSRSALKSALDFYLDMPTQANGIYSMKTITERPDDPYKLLLEKLEHLARDLGSNVSARYHIDPLVEGDSPIDFGDAVLEVLKQSSPVVDNPIVSCMEILVKIVLKLGVSIREMHAIDLIANDRPSFPEMVFGEIQKAHHGLRIELPLYIVFTPCSKWCSLWKIIYCKAIEETGGSVAADVEFVKKKLVETDCAFLVDDGRPSRYSESEASLRTRNAFTREPDSPSQSSQNRQEIKKAEPERISPQRNAGLSKTGIMKAFDQMGQDLAEQESLAWQTGPRISTGRSDQMFTEQDRQTSIGERDKTSFNPEFAPNTSATAQAKEYSRRQESDRIETSAFMSLLDALSKLNNETLEIIGFIILAFVVLLFKALTYILFLFVGFISLVFRSMWTECLGLREEPFRYENYVSVR